MKKRIYFSVLNYSPLMNLLIKKVFRINPDRKKQVLSLFVNSYLVLSTIAILIYGISKGAGAGQVGENMYGWGYLKAFTNLSNLLAGLISIVALFYNIKILRGETSQFPRPVLVLRYLVSTAVGLTFLTVAVFLGPMFSINKLGYFTLFSDEMLFFHLINPILCCVELVVLENQHKLSRQDNFLALLPTFLYSVVYATMVIGFGIWSDFYNFTLGGHYELAPFSFLVMLGVTYLIAYILRRLHNTKVKS